MRRRPAPASPPVIFVAAQSLTRSALMAAPRTGPGGLLAPGLADALVALCSALGRAIVDPSGRAAHLEDADAALVTVRVVLPLLRDLRGLSAEAAQQMGEEAAEIGRMLGGWRRRLDREARRPVRANAANAIQGDHPEGPTA